MLANVLGLLAAFVYVAGTAVQQQGVLRARRRTGPLLLLLITTPVWIAGFALNLAGFGIHAVALGLGSLAVLSVLQASEVVFMLPFSAWTAKAPIGTRELVGSAVVLVGLVGTIFYGRVAAGVPDRGAPKLVLAVAIAAVIAGCLVAVSGLVGNLRAGVLGAASGILYGVMSAMMKIVMDELEVLGIWGTLTDWRVYVLGLVGLAALIIQAVALGAGHLSSVLSAILVFNPITATLIAVTVFGEEFTTSGFGWLALGVSVVLAIGGALSLARSPAIAVAH